MIIVVLFFFNSCFPKLKKKNRSLPKYQGANENSSVLTGPIFPLSSDAYLTTLSLASHSSLSCAPGFPIFSGLLECSFLFLANSPSAFQSGWVPHPSTPTTLWWWPHGLSLPGTSVFLMVASSIQPTAWSTPGAQHLFIIWKNKENSKK